MSQKKSGLPFEVHPTPAKGKDGQHIVYVRPARGMKLSMKFMDDFCSKNYGMRYGELTRAFDVFLRAAAEMIAEGYRIETPIGSFGPRLSLKGTFTDADAVKERDVRIDGVDYNPGKLWNKPLEQWLFNGFRRVDNPNTQELMADEAHLEEALQKSLKKRGFTTAKSFAYHSGLTYYSARKQLDKWTEGDTPKLLKTWDRHEYIYTET